MKVDKIRSHLQCRAKRGPRLAVRNLTGNAAIHLIVHLVECE